MFTCFFFFFKQKTAYEMRISDWSSDVCSSDLVRGAAKHVWMVSIGVAALVGFVAWRMVAVPILPGDSGLNTPPVEIVRKADGIQYATRLGEIRRSEERRVGKEWVSACRYRWSPYHEKKKASKTRRNTAH